MILVAQSLLSLLAQNPQVVVAVVIVGIIPRKVRLCKGSNSQSRHTVEVEAYLWCFKRTEHEWQLRLTTVRFLGRRK